MVTRLVVECIVSRHAEEDGGSRRWSDVVEVGVEEVDLAVVRGSVGVVPCLANASFWETSPVMRQLAARLGPAAFENYPYIDAIRLVLFLTGLGVLA